MGVASYRANTRTSTMTKFADARKNDFLADLHEEIMRFEPHSESRPDLARLAELQEENLKASDLEAKKRRREAWAACIGFTLLIAFLFGLVYFENERMTQSQRETIARIFN
jgi:hypothetical protein